MAATNAKVRVAPVFTHEGGQAQHVPAVAELRRTVMACMLWENGFYESGVSVADRIKSLVHSLPMVTVAAMAVEARSRMHLRHVPLLMVRELARHPQLSKSPGIVADTLEAVIQRADELSEFLAIYWKDGKTPLSAQVKKGLARAFNKFDEYALAKYNRDHAIKLRDVLFLAHAKPADVDTAPEPEGHTRIRYTKAERAQVRAGTLEVQLTEREELFRKLVDGELATPDTWEVRLSASTDKAASWRDLMRLNRIGGLAFLRNLRNMNETGIAKPEVKAYGDAISFDRVLPFRFIASARAVPAWEEIIEPWMLKSLNGAEKIGGKTRLIVDVSGSMDSRMSAKSDLRRIDAACGLAILLRELCEEIQIATFSSRVVIVPPRRGFALRDAIIGSQHHASTYLAAALLSFKKDVDRTIVITDEQSQDGCAPPVGFGWMINVASNQNGVGYGSWTTITGFSEAVVQYIREFEANVD